MNRQSRIDCGRSQRHHQTNANEAEENAIRIVLTQEEKEVLMDAAECGDTETVRRLIQDGVNVNFVKDKTTTTLLDLMKSFAFFWTRVPIRVGAIVVSLV